MADKLRIAIIGCGNNGFGHAEILGGMDEVEIAAMVDSDPQRREEMKKRFPDVHIYQDYKNMFRERELDAVCISTPHNFHYEQVMAALENNCHVLLEKPMAIVEKHCREMTELAEKKNLILQVGFECRGSKLYMRVKEIVESGEIGRLLSVSFVRYRGSWMKDWYCRRESAGNGMTIIETCHYIDLMRYWSQAEVEWVFASSPEANFRTEYEYPDSTFCQLGFGNGMLANIIDSHARSADCFMKTQLDSSKSYGAGEGEYMDPVYGHQFEYSLVGTNGAMWVRMFEKQISVLEMQPPDSGKRPRIVLKRVEDYAKQSLHELVHDCSMQDRKFVESIQNGKPPILLPQDALKTHLVAFAIENSEQFGEKITVQY